MVFQYSLSLRPNNTITDAKKLFSKTNYSSLPVTNNDNKLIGVIKLKDIIHINFDKQELLSYITQDYLKIKSPIFSESILEICCTNCEQYSELFLIDENGKILDIINMLSFVAHNIPSNRIVNELQFLMQIASPTSLARCILDDLNDSVIIVDKDSVILYANQAYGRILGVDYKKIIGRPLSKIEPTAKLIEVAKNGNPVNGEILYVKSIGKTLVVNITPIRFQDNLVAAIAIASDITKITKIANDLDKMNLVNKLLTKEINSNIKLPEPFRNIIGSSLDLRKQLGLAAEIAPVDVPVLILGESGTGKELVAKAIHETSSRKSGPFVSINCAAIPDNLFESELFGYEKGAFTGAKTEGKIGKVEKADGGTLFLDEIGDMPLPMQAKILRFLQEKEFNKVGGIRSKTIDFRLITATNKKLHIMVENREFREDLFFRINTFIINLPPLRGRKIDIYNLLEYYKKSFEDRYEKSHLDFSSECLKILLDYPWPGNIRELKNIVEHVVVIANRTINIDDLPDYIREHFRENCPKENNIVISKPTDNHDQEYWKKAILDALAKTNNNKTEAMNILGISRRTFYKKMKELNI